jgi:hypothetical protein
LTGLEFVKSIKDPTVKAIVTQFNKSVDAEAESYLQPLNVASILTDDLRKYNDKSFTFDRDEADKDPEKILVKIDPVAKMTTLDETGKNYEKQKKEAFDYVRGKIISKLDEEKKISTTGQLSETEAQKLRAQSNYPKPTPVDKDAPKPVTVGETLLVRPKGKTDKASITGAVSAIDNLIIAEGEGDKKQQNVVKAIGYNSNNGALEITGETIIGQKQSSRKGPAVKGSKTETSSSKTIANKNKFLSNSIENPRLLSIAVTKIPNPERKGYNFSNITEAEDYYKRQYESQIGGTAPATASTLAPASSNIPSASNSEWLQSGWKQSQINEAVKLGKIKVQ